jgi:hypothetical protein
MVSENIAEQLKAALEECARLKEENRNLKSLLGFREEKPNTTMAEGLSQEGKVALFRSLFRGREDVYPLRWEARTEKSGYSPACANEWKRSLCVKPWIKCSECENRELLPVTDDLIQQHLIGKRTIGVYPLLPDETCWFLAADFDKATWKEDAGAFLMTCDVLGVPAVLERSRSGNGVHIWIFFDSPIEAVLAQKLGSAILTYTMERHPQLGFDSYDRFFPSQDTMPKGGFGSLIALPFQSGPQDKGNSVFLDKDFNPYPDQWSFLSGVRKMQRGEVEAIVHEAQRKGKIIGVRMSLTEEGEEDLIFDDLLNALEEGCSPLLLTERTEHVDEFAERLKGFARNVIVLRSGTGKKERKALTEQIASIPDGEERVLIATGRYIGEGFDDARLDTLFLTMPISWRGTLQQYAGRLHRLHDNKRIVRIYDYVDVNVPMFTRMFQKRLKGYKAIGYSVRESQRANHLTGSAPSLGLIRYPSPSNSILFPSTSSFCTIYPLINNVLTNYSFL